MIAMPGTKHGKRVMIVVTGDDLVEMSPEMWTGWFASFGATGLVATGDAVQTDTIPNTPHPVVSVSCERY